MLLICSFYFAALLNFIWFSKVGAKLHNNQINLQINWYAAYRFILQWRVPNPWTPVRLCRLSIHPICLNEDLLARYRLNSNDLKIQPGYISFTPVILDVAREENSFAPAIWDARTLRGRHLYDQFVRIGLVLDTTEHNHLWCHHDRRIGYVWDFIYRRRRRTVSPAQKSPKSSPI